MINNPTWAGIREAYANSFATLKSLPCDVFLGPHAPFFDMEARCRMLSGKPNPFIDQQGISDISHAGRKSYLEQVAKEERTESK